ncbi:MAG: DUF1549 domain-containing protein [Cyclobacteriaceae bacterium]|nr:DUF1549 domain-containing protein [Cyclobacteriaceae bacterium]
MDFNGFWLWQFLGRLHPLIVHFPVALLVFAGLMELLSIRKYDSKWRPGIQAMVWAGGLSAVFAAIAGILLAENQGSSGDLLDLHKITGLATAVLSLVVIGTQYRISTHKTARSIITYRISLFVTLLVLTIAGHMGASLTHGEDYLSSTLPWNVRSDDFTGDFDVEIYETGSGTLNAAQELKLLGQVRAILAHNCYKCHSGAKIEGELRLDAKDHIFAGGSSGQIIHPGAPDKSEIIRRITLPKNHKEVMPSKGELLHEKEIAVIRLWIEKGALWPEGAEQHSVYRVAQLEPRRPELPLAKNNISHPIDRLVDDYFQQKNIPWQQLVDDKTYLRRIYLDIIGLMPSPEEMDSFIQDTRPDKKSIWLRALLDRNDDYAMHWLTFWNDALRNDYTGTGYITRGRFNITDWLYQSLKTNKPYETFVKELLNPDNSSKGFIAGIQWRGSVNSSQSTEMQAAQNVGQVLLGLNLKCASCHDSFISDWKLDQAYAFANIFADSVLEIHRCDKPTGVMASTKILWEELGDIDSAANRAEKLRQLADALVQPANGRLSRTLVNRIWKQMMGRGIVEPVDEMDNEPWSQDLLDWLASEFAEKGYDMKELMYWIGTSQIYQSASVTVQNPDELMAEDYIFRGVVRRRLTAEQFSDAVSQLVTPVFETEELKYNPFSHVAESSDHSFARASLVANNGFLTALGRPNREIVSTSRDTQASLLQSLELTNGERLFSVLEKGAEAWQQQYSNGDAIIQEFYRKALFRKPMEKELLIAKQALGESPEAEQIQDFFWAVLLMPEFQLIY